MHAKLLFSSLVLAVNIVGDVQAYDNGPQVLGCDYKFGNREGTDICLIHGSGVGQGITWTVFEIQNKRFRHYSSSPTELELIDSDGNTITTYQITNTIGQCRPGGEESDIYSFRNGDRICLYWGKQVTPLSAQRPSISSSDPDIILATKTPTTLVDHSRTSRLDDDFGFRIQVPSNWRDAEWGVLVPKELKFGWVWNPPNGLDGGLHVEVAAAPTINGHVATCIINDLASIFSKDVLESGLIPIDFETGQRLTEPRVEIKYFDGIEPPAPVGINKPWPRDSKKAILLACSATHAYSNPAHNEKVQFLTRIFSKYYMYTVYLETDKVFAPVIAGDYSRIVHSIRVRCGEEGSQWCGSKF